MSLISPILGLLFFVSEAWLFWRRRSQPAAGEGTNDRGSLRLLWRVIGVAITLAVVLSALRVGPRLPAGVPWGLIGLIVWSAGAAFRWWAIQHLGRFFTVDVAVTSEQRVIDDGPFTLIRHPSYAGLWIESLGLGLALGSVAAVVLLTIPILLALRYRIRIEETVLRSALGASYQEYCARTKMLVPWVY